MSASCFICDQPLSDGETVNVVRGINNLRTASIDRNDGHIEHLKNLVSVTVHKKCRQVYINKNSITAAKRRQEDEALLPDSPRKKRFGAFDFKSLCMFCGSAADEEAEQKKPAKYKRIISKVSTLEFKDSMLKKADERGDSLGRSVKNRIQCEHDLVAAEAKYHKDCYNNFYCKVPVASTSKTSHEDEQVAEAMKEIFFYIENNDDSQFTLAELKSILTDYVPKSDTIIRKLKERYSYDIKITTKVGSFTIISFRDSQAEILSKAWYENKKSTLEEERLRIVETAAAIIREDIRSVVVDDTTYPPPSKMFDNINENIPKSLLHFMQEVIMKNKKGNMDLLKRKCTALSHAIMASLRVRSFSSPLLLGLSVFLHRRYGSRKLIEILSSLSFSAAYSDTIKYELSALLHPKPRILPSESGALVQYVADNTDINVNTLDGHNTIHIMGMIKIVTPESAVIPEGRMKKSTTKHSAKEVVENFRVPVLQYENHSVPGLSKIQLQNLDEEEVLNRQMFNKVDLLWMYGKWKNITPLPGWNGFIEHLTRNNRNFSISRILFLPFIHQAASNMDTVYTTLWCAVNAAKEHNQTTCIITFDQPLYIKAREIVAASEAHSDLSKIVVRLGGFHMILSFLGCIGYIMDGSGIKEALSTIYATKSIDKMLDGHAYARSIRAHMLLRLALSKIIFKETGIEDSNDLDTYIEQIMISDISYKDVEESDIDSLINQVQATLSELQARGPTAQLWLQYLDMVSIAIEFLRAERLGLFNEHLEAAKKMLPYFHASGHFLYAKSTHLYIQDMLKLEETMDHQTFNNFKNGFFTVRRTDKFNCGVSTDQTIEQTINKDSKSIGGFSRRGTQESVITTFTNTTHVTNIVCEEVEKFCKVSLDSSEQHVDSRDSRVKRDDTDVDKLSTWFDNHNPFPNIQQIVSIGSGIVGNEKINCYKARDVGLQSLKKIVGMKLNEIKFKRADKVLPLSTINCSVKVNDCKVSMDPLLLFQRITVNKKFDEHLQEYLQYELSPYPTSLFDNGSMRKTTKSKLYNIMNPINIELNQDDITHIIDGGFLLHRVEWGNTDTFSTILKNYVKYLQNHFATHIVVIFDGYSDNSKNIKAMEQSRRSGGMSALHEVHFDASTIPPISQQKFLSNRNNKKNLIEMLIEKLQGTNIATKQARDDADVLIVETAIEESYNRTSVIVGEDIDLLVLLIGRTQTNQQPIFFKKIGRGNVETRIYSYNSFDKYPCCKNHILFLHAFTGCDTTSAIFNKGKVQVMKKFEKHPNLYESAELFQQENCTPDALFENGSHFILAVYNAPKDETSIDNLRYRQFIKSTRLNRPVKLSSLPPTSAATRQHIYRVYYQVQTWLGKNLQPQEWGWTLKDNVLEPQMTLLAPAPHELLNQIFCNCTKGCGAKCGCRKVGLKCSTVCGHCLGQACLNASEQEEEESNDVDNNDEIYPEEMLESNIKEDDKDQDDLEMELERPTEENEDDDED